MQSLPQESSPALPFTYCLFLDDHFPMERESPLSLSLHIQASSGPDKSPLKYAESRTQASFIAPDPEETFSRSMNSSPTRKGFLSTQDSDSDLEGIDILVLSSDEHVMANEKDPTLRKSRRTCRHLGRVSPSFKGGVETTSLELNTRDRLSERKSGFSIWSVISPDLGIDFETNRSSFGTRSAKVSVKKLRKALRDTHFKRVEGELRKLLGRNRS